VIMFLVMVANYRRLDYKLCGTAGLEDKECGVDGFVSYILASDSIMMLTMAWDTIGVTVDIHDA
jgi:hypothetical protein